MKETQEEYEELRDKCVASFKKVFKDSLAFDMNEVSKETRFILSEDPKYQSATKRIKAELYAKSIMSLQKVIDEEVDVGQNKDPTGNILKAIEMRNKVLFSDLNIDADDSNALNITMIYLSREDFKKMETVTMQITDNAVVNLDAVKVPEAITMSEEEEEKGEHIQW